ncbi:MAG: tRNA uridine-5-carboxymethylaminomethyl(34) synthesis GTPase MnmE [candidate division WOR-3 bacterium]
MNDTIVACATPTGYSSIAVIRISGEDAVNFLKKIFISAQEISIFQSGHIYYGRIRDPLTQDTIDLVLATVFFAPYSYTGENVVEISCHGNPLIVDRIIKILLQLGARLAQPGEFTKRAFLNNKIDLVQAEAVLDTIFAHCDVMRRAAIYQLEGHLSNFLEEVKNKLVSLLTKIEVSIDFPDEDEIEIGLDFIKNEVNKIDIEIEKLLKNSEQGIKVKKGYRVVIAGRPNVGKSTLFNRILGYERAIIHETPGTTRDFIEEEIEIEGILIRLIDTAGIFNYATGPDEIAAKRSLELLRNADLVLLVFDASEPMNEQDTSLYNLTRDLNKIFIINKIDLNLKLQESEILSDAIKLSAKTGENIDLLKKHLREHLLPVSVKENGLIIRQRHIDTLRRLSCCLQNVRENYSIETIAFELHTALDIIGELTGSVLREDILNKIFEEFCIGK